MSHRLPVNMKLTPRLFGMLGDEYCCDRVFRRWRVLALFSSDDLHENKIKKNEQNKNRAGEERRENEVPPKITFSEFFERFLLNYWQILPTPQSWLFAAQAMSPVWPSYFQTSAGW